MEGFMDKLTNVLGGFADRVNSLRYIIVIKNAFYALIPVTSPICIAGLPEGMQPA
jgi:PTS system cellobiose-specific IIC component